MKQSELYLRVEERTEILRLQDKLWVDFNDSDKTDMKEGGVLTLEEWEWLKALLSTTALYAEVAQGFTTPHPFVLCIETPPGEGWEQLLMIHPSQLPKALEERDPLEVFREVEKLSE